MRPRVVIVRSDKYGQLTKGNRKVTRLRIVLEDVVGGLMGMKMRAVPILRQDLIYSLGGSVGTWHPNARKGVATCKRRYRTT